MQGPQQRTSIKHLAVAALLAAAAVVQPAAAQGRPDLVEQSMRDRPFVAGQMLVQFRADANAPAQAAALAFLGASRAETVLPAGRRADGKGDLHLLHIPPGLAVADAVRAMGQLAEVDFAEPNWIYRHQAVSNDPYFTNGSLWGMYGNTSSPTNQYGSQAGDAVSNDCSGVWVGIIDEGYMYTHEDLAANAGTNPGETADGIDNDGNGLVDDVYGWDFDGNNASVFDGVGDDHGTHVAGTIGGVGGNGRGVAGVCWNVKMIGAKFLGRNGGTTANAIKAVNYMTDLKARQGINLVATNNSWGGGGFSQGLKDAIDGAGVADILFVAAAGNAGANNDATPSYPASYASANIIAVASITSSGALSSFSSYGATTVDLGAPGSGILSTVPVSRKGKVVSGYATYSGTSMATPHVTGAAALYAARNSNASAADIKAAILNSAVPTFSLAGKTATGGRLDVSGF